MIYVCTQGLFCMADTGAELTWVIEALGMAKKEIRGTGRLAYVCLESDTQVDQMRPRLAEKAAADKYGKTVGRRWGLQVVANRGELIAAMLPGRAAPRGGHR